MFLEEKANSLYKRHSYPQLKNLADLRKNIVIQYIQV